MSIKRFDDHINKIISLYKKKGSLYLIKSSLNILSKKLFSEMESKLQPEKYIVRHNDFPLIKGGVFDDFKVAIPDNQSKNFDIYYNMIRQHRFDLLGSGWLKNSSESISPGINGFNHSNKSKREEKFSKKIRNKSKRIYKILKVINRDYETIDWHRDIKSGYRWPKDIWKSKVQYAHLPGVDIKNPWELSRMNHLVRLAFLSANHEDIKIECFKEFMCQFLDFYLSNPAGYGVNWRSNMDVAIRAVNLLVAKDLFGDIKIKGIKKNWFDRLFSKSLYEHGNFIYKNLEYSSVINSNHYIAELCGLLIAGLYFEKNEETSSWIEYALKELKIELKKQFLDDGCSIEDSIYYHSFVLDMLIYTLGICKKSGVSLEGFDLRRICKGIAFIKDVRISGKHLPLMGDCDSGVFIKSDIVGDIISKDEALKKYHHLSENKTFWKEQSINEWLDEDILYYEYPFENNDSIKGQFFEYLYSDMQLRPDNRVSYIKKVFKPNKFDIEKELFFSDASEDAESLRQSIRSEITVYPEGKWAVIKNNTLKCVISTGTVDVNGWISGHSHNDALSFVLEINKKLIINDPGCYLYTPFFEERYKERSAFNHNVPFFDGVEQNNLLKGKKGLFYSEKASKTDTFVEGDRLVVRICFANFKNPIVRRFIPGSNHLRIVDCAEVDFKQNIYKGKGSQGYGKKLR